LADEMELEIKEVYLVINRVPKDMQEHPKIKELKESNSFKDVFLIPMDDELIKHAFDGQPLSTLSKNSIAVKAVNSIVKSSEAL
jgi:CO dehydrogenase maturation factor